MRKLMGVRNSEFQKCKPISFEKGRESAVNYESIKKYSVGYNCDQYIALPIKFPHRAFTL